MELNYNEYILDDVWKVWRQKDMKTDIVYDENYVESRYGRYNYINCIRLNILRLNIIVDNFITNNANKIIDFGCGNGIFIELCNAIGMNAFGHDISNYKTNFRKISYADILKYKPWDIITFFDSLEHIINPFDIISEINAKYILMSFPNCKYLESAEWFMKWKHRRPGEHLWHFNEENIVYPLNRIGYHKMFSSSIEDIVRNDINNVPNIITIGFKKDII